LGRRSKNCLRSSVYSEGEEKGLVVAGVSDRRRQIGGGRFG